MQTTRFEALERALAIVGGTQEALATVVGRRQSSVSEVYRRVQKGGDVPAEWCLPIERATTEKGEPITRQQLRPDLWPADEQAGQAA